MNPETISISVGYGNDRPTLHLRMITMAEEQDFLNRYTDIADLPPAQKAEKEFQICVDALKAWSEMPTKKVEKPGKNGQVDIVDVPYVEADSPAEAIEQIFKPRTIKTERMAHLAINSFRVKLQPQVDFL